jgi:hypothetical protein
MHASIASSCLLLYEGYVWVHLESWTCNESKAKQLERAHPHLSCPACEAALSLCELFRQENPILVSPGMFRMNPESLEHMYALLEVRKEVEALLSPVYTHPNILQLLGVVVDGRRRPVKLLFELAPCGDLGR